MIVLDSSVVLAAAFGEPGAIALDDILQDAAISSFNLGESASKFSERGVEARLREQYLDLLAPFCHPLTMSQDLQAGRWRAETKRFGLSMGDRCCLALGLELEAEVYTTDRAWAGVDLGVRVRVIR